MYAPFVTLKKKKSVLFKKVLLTTKTKFVFALPFIFFSCGDSKTPKQLPALEVPVIQVQNLDVNLEADFTGQTFGASDVKIAPRVYGLVQTMDFREGTVVKEGDLLYTIDPMPYRNKVDEANGALAEANTMMVKAKADLDMIEPLFKINAVSKREFVSSKAQYEASQGKVQAAEAALRNAQIELGFCSVVAPISGLIGLSKVRVGDYVSQGPLAILNTISQLDSIRVRFTISEQEFMRIQRETNSTTSALKGTDQHIQLVLSDGSLYEHQGKLSFADRQIDPTTGAITIEASFQNPDGLLRPGQYVRVRLITAVQKNALLIPQRSVIEMQGIFQVYVLGDSNKVHTKIIKTGRTYKDAYLVAEGLTAKDKIAIGGTQLLKNGSAIIPKETQWQAGVSETNPKGK